MVKDHKLIKSFLKASYRPGKKIKNNVYDTSLSGKRVSVYHNPVTNKTTIIHRGTASVTDWFKTNLPMALGYESGNRFKHAKKIQKLTEKKYGAENVTTMGHSLGGRLAEKFGKNSSKIITYNKAATPRSILQTAPTKQLDIRTSKDLVSRLASFQKHNRPIETIHSTATSTVVNAHNLNRL